MVDFTINFYFFLLYFQAYWWQCDGDGDTIGLFEGGGLLKI
jgi:hypothetical protein